MNTPRITIGITSYNAIETIDSAIASAMDQDWPSTEIIIVDDQSTDGTWEHLSEKHKNLTLILHDKNKGVAAARNTIIENAKGEYIAFFDDDDTSARDRISKQYKAITSPPARKNTICHTGRQQNFKNETYRIEKCVTSGHAESIAARILFGKPLPNKQIGSFATCSQMASTQLYKTLGGFDENFRRGEDTDLAIRAAINGAYFIGVQEPLVTQTMTHGAEKKLDEEYKYACQLLKKHHNFLTKHGHGKHAQQWLDMKFHYYRGEKARFIKALLTLALLHPIHTIQRILWALPNVGFNMRYKKFQSDHE